MRGGYEPVRGLAHTDLTLFWNDGGWHRRDLQVWQRPWEVPEITSALDAAGFACLSFHDAATSGMTGDIATGRVFAAATA